MGVSVCVVVSSSVLVSGRVFMCVCVCSKYIRSSELLCHIGGRYVQCT